MGIDQNIFMIKDGTSRLFMQTSQDPELELKEWFAVVDPKSGFHYFWNILTNGVQWELPIQ